MSSSRPGVAAGHGGNEGNIDVEGAFVEERQCLHHVVLDGVHRPGMKRDVPRNQTVLQAAPVQLLHDGPQGGFAAADDGIGRRVLAGDLDLDRSASIQAEWNLQSVQQQLHAGAIEADRQHSTGPCHTLLQRGAMEDQARRVSQGKCSAGVGGGNLAGAVADHAVRVDPPRLEQLDERALEHEDDGLGQLAFVELRLRGRETGLAQRDLRVFPPVFVDCIDDAAEDGIGVVEIAAATGPLRALSGEHHHQPSLALVHGGDRRAFLRDGGQRLSKFLEVAYSKGRAGGEMGAAAAETAGQRVEVHGPLVQHLAQPPRALGQRFRGPRRQGNHEAGVRSQGHRPDAGPRRAVLAHHAVPVGASEAEGVDADHDGMLGKRLDFRLYPHGTALEVDLRIRHHEVLRCRREGASLHHQDDLEQRAMKGGRFHVPDVALDAGYAQRNVPFESPERLGDGVAFDTVPDHGARRMGFDVVEFAGSASGAGGRRAHQIDLCVAGRRGDVAPRRKADGVVGRAGRIDRGRLDHGMNGVSIPLGRLQGLQREDECAFGPHVAVGLGVE